SIVLAAPGAPTLPEHVKLAFLVPSASESQPTVTLLLVLLHAAERRYEVSRRVLREVAQDVRERYLPVVLVVLPAAQYLGGGLGQVWWQAGLGQGVGDLVHLGRPSPGTGRDAGQVRRLGQR